MEHKLKEFETKMISMNKKNNVGLLVAILCLLMMVGLVATNTLG